MSASEKLKALERDAGYLTVVSEVSSVLPQIVAVIEAAEKGVSWDSITSSIGVEDGRKLWAALDELDKALS